MDLVSRKAARKISYRSKEQQLQHRKMARKHRKLVRSKHDELHDEP